MNKLRSLGILFIVYNMASTGDAILCSQCDTEESWKCLADPPEPTVCPGFDYCIQVSKYSSEEKLLSYTRSCSPMPFPNMCIKGRDKKDNYRPVKLCYKVCSTDGCNHRHSINFLETLMHRKRK